MGGVRAWTYGGLVVAAVGGRAVDRGSSSAAAGLWGGGRVGRGGWGWRRRLRLIRRRRRRARLRVMIRVGTASMGGGGGMRYLVRDGRASRSWSGALVAARSVRADEVACAVAWVRGCVWVFVSMRGGARWCEGPAVGSGHDRSVRAARLQSDVELGVGMVREVGVACVVGPVGVCSVARLRGCAWACIAVSGDEGGRATVQTPWRAGGCVADAVRIVGGDVASVPWRWRGCLIVSGGAMSCVTVWVRVSVWAVACVGEGGHAFAQPSWAAGGTTVDAVRVVGGDVAFVLLRWCGGSVASGGVVIVSWRWRGGLIVSGGAASCAIVWVHVSVWAVV